MVSSKKLARSQAGNRNRARGHSKPNRSREAEGTGGVCERYRWNHFSPLADICDYQLVVSSEGILSFRSFAGLTALLESLSIACLQFCGEEVYQRLEEGEKLISDFEVFCPGKLFGNDEMSSIKKMAQPTSIPGDDPSA